ncbi:hypothetical protein TNCV_3377661 [Trichonephila clavipes]|nr:hypothetical protein TNCV_3377661 [Trichonephila clavipes]
MSSRHQRILIGKIEEGRKITDVARQFDIAHSVVSRIFKTTGMCSRRHGEVVLEVRRLQKTIYRPSAKRNRRTTAQRWQNHFQESRFPKNTFEGGDNTHADLLCVSLRQHRTAHLQLSITIGLNRAGHAYYFREMSSDCRRQLIWREWYCLSSRKGPILVSWWGTAS